MAAATRLPRDDDLGALVRRATSTRLLSPAQETEVAIQIEQGEQSARDRMIESNLRLVFLLARSYAGRGVTFADLVQEGTLGLIRAVEGFDHRRGLKFSTYAVWWIKRSLRDAVAGAEVIRIPPRANRQVSAVRRAEDELRRAAPGTVSTADVAEHAGLSPRSVRSLRRVARVTRSLDEPCGEDGAPLSELVADEYAVDPSDSVIAGEETKIVRDMVKLLPDRHRDVVVRRYGLAEQSPQSHRRIGASLGVGEERSRQLEREALRRLRALARVPSRS